MNSDILVSKNMVSNRSFHNYVDLDLAHRHTRTVETKELKEYVVLEREVSYRITLHQHPYVGQLVKRLLESSVAGLQSADTDYIPGNVAMPQSVELSVDKDTELSVPAASRFTILNDTAATPDGGGPATNLSAGMELGFTAPSQVKFIKGVSTTLLDGLPATPPPGSRLNLDSPAGAWVLANARIELTTDTKIELFDGKPATLAAGTQLLLLSGVQITLPGGTQATLIRSQPLPTLYSEFLATYAPSVMVERPYPVKDLDFTTSGAYSVYNWELFYHIPLTIGINLSKNGRYADALRWFSFLFDPTDDSDGPTPERFWKVRPFQHTDVKKLEDILVNLATGDDQQLRDETTLSIHAWQEAPFRPFVIARYRQQAFMYKTIMAYLDNLIAWGDALFRQDTGEAIDEALMLYVLAVNILGPRPQPVPAKNTTRPQTYANLRGDLNQFGVVLRQAETLAPFDILPFPTGTTDQSTGMVTISSLGKVMYFCVPPNDKLLSYWDIISDRLFKIHNSLNFQGTFRQLALFDPPIDPALLARAVAAGLDIGAVVNGLNQPLPLVRFQMIVQKAVEICQEVKSLGNNLLSALEKEDGEALAILRAKHERTVLEMAEHVKYTQVQEAIKSREGLLTSLALAVQRFSYYEQQLGTSAAEINIPELAELDQGSLDRMKLSASEPEVGLRPVPIDIAQDLGESGGKIVSSFEAEDLSKSQAARTIHDVVKILNLTAQGLSLIPDFGIDLHYWGLGGNSDIVGGSKLSQVARFSANVAEAAADRLNYEAGQAAKIGSFARREQDWAFQRNLAAGEITQIFKQIRAAELRQAIAEKELANHRVQMKQSLEVEQFLNEDGSQKKGKRTNKSLYAWLNREVRGLYGQCFQFAFDIAKQAERALQHELGNTDLSYIQFGYQAGKEGLLAGEKLWLDLKHMEMAYHDLNAREYELTKHVSLLQLDPLALLKLRTTGSCSVSLPEALFDMDGPGHYFRRIKSVAVSIPCVTGPYASVNCTLSLTKSTIRTSSVTRRRKIRRAERRRPSLQQLLRQPAEHRHQLVSERWRHVRNEPARRAVSAV